MKDWNGKNVESAVSKGGVIALVNPYDNLIKTGLSPWPPAEITQKLYSSRQGSAFAGRDFEVCSSYLGYYCDLQSLHSEDAITWSVFGPLANTGKEILSRWLSLLCISIDLPEVQCEKAQISLWRRIPHPDTLVSEGPEIDISITTENAVILCEAKWLSKTGCNQGKLKNKDQIQLRSEYLKVYGHLLYPDCTEFVVLGIVRSPGTMDDKTSDFVKFREVTWEHVCSNKLHPLQEELYKYYQWKTQHSKAYY